MSGHSSPIDAVPPIVIVAGEHAAENYLAYFDEVLRNQNTRSNYGSIISRFLRWADRRGLTLTGITGADATTYLQEVCPSGPTSASAVTYLNAIRGLLRHFVTTGVLTANPLETPHSAKMATNARRRPKTRVSGGKSNQHADDQRFPLLALLAILANMVKESREQIFEREALAVSLLDFVRWRDGPKCTHCGAAGDDLLSPRDERPDHRCASCGRNYLVTDGSPFENSPVPLRHALFLLHAIYLSDAPMPADEVLLRDHVLEAAVVQNLTIRFKEALASEGFTVGDDLRLAVARTNRELVQDEVGRDIIEYAELTKARDELVRVKTDGSAIEDLPEGVSIDEALATIEARIAEHDRYVISVKDGYLVSQLAES